MSVYQEFVCETCRLRHPIPRIADRDKYFEKLKTKHEKEGHITNSYNDVAPDGRRGDDLWYETAGYGDESHLWIKDYYLFTVVKDE